MQKLVIGILLFISTFCLAETSINIDNSRAILIRGEIQEYNMLDAIAKLKAFEKESTKKPVYIILNSPGGSVLDGFELINTIEDLNNKNVETICIVETMAYSMAALITTYCKTAYIHKFASLMYHEASYGVQGSQSTINTRVAFTNIYLHTLNKDVAKKLNLTVEDYENKIHNEWWLNAEEALKYNIVKDVLDTVSYTVEPAKEPESMFLFGFEYDRNVLKIK